MALTTTSSSPAVAQCSWAQIVRGTPAPAPAPARPAEDQEVVQEEVVQEEAVQPLQPARRGERLCRCIGQVLVMLRHYGWIAPLDDIEHPDSRKNGGRIYVAVADVEPGSVLNAGDRVSFFLYVDMQGLGAEGCCLASAVPAQSPRAGARSLPGCGLWAGAAEFVPAGLSVGAAEFVPATGSTPTPRGLSAEAVTFQPGPRVLSAGAAVFQPSPSELSADAKTFEPLPGAAMFKARLSELSAHAKTFEPLPQATVVKPSLNELSADATTFEPLPRANSDVSALSANAAVFAPKPPRLRLLPPANEFAPGGGMSVGAAVFAPAKSAYGSVLQFNDAYLSDSEDEDGDEGAEAGDELSSEGGEAELSDGSADSWRRRAGFPMPTSLQGHVELDDDLDVVVLCAPLKVSGGILSAGSTSASEHSDSEDELDSPETPAALLAVGVPPGLSVFAS